MELINQIGHLQHWGLSPAQNLLKHVKAQPREEGGERPLRVLMSGVSDVRHILKTLCDIEVEEAESKRQKFSRVEIYFHETNKELLCRCLLFLHVLHETSLNFEERIELFLDLYGNAMIKERNARYLQNFKEDLLNFIHDEKNVVTPIKKLVSLRLLKFQERDEMSEIVQSWSSNTPFDMARLRDTKIRYLYKERYDYRANLVDWDYNMLLLPCAPIVHYYHYKEWRLSGLAFEQRFSTYCQPNRTLSSYAPGRKKEERTSCLVRGYWGDIVVSPYVALGVSCEYKQKDLLFKKANYKFIGHSVELAEYNMNYWLKMIETGEEYSKIFRDYYRTDEETKKKLEEKDGTKQEAKKKGKEGKGELGEIREENEEDRKQEQAKEQNKGYTKGQNKEQGKEEEIRQKQEEIRQKPEEKPAEKLPPGELDSDEEELKKKVDSINSKQIEYSKAEKEVLRAFKKYEVSIQLMGMRHENLIGKGKYNDYFDVVALGFIHSAYLTKGVEGVLAKGGLLIQEKATFLIPKKKEERKELNQKLMGLIEKEKGWKLVESSEEAFTYRRE